MLCFTNPTLIYVSRVLTNRTPVSEVVFLSYLMTSHAETCEKHNAVSDEKSRGGPGHEIPVGEEKRVNGVVHYSSFESLSLFSTQTSAMTVE